jgi:dynactin complex subunit
VGSSATAGELGDYFQYVIDHPVTLPRQKSAMLPIVQKDVEAARVSIYNERTQAKHPLLGLRFKNTTGMHLMQGPITVFEGSSYAGDARVLDIQPKDERLISYAIDLGTEVEPVAKKQPDRLTKVKVNKGILYRTDKVREEKTYNVKNRSEHDRTVLIEHPFRPDFSLVSKDKPAERARDVYRFELKVAAGQSASEEVVEEKDVGSSISLSNSDDDTMRFFLSQPVTSEAVKKALTDALALKGKVDGARREVEQLQKQLKDITDDQARLRANLKEMPPTAEAYKRYLKKFDDQETQIEGFRSKIKELQDVEFTHRKAFDDFLAKLDVE